MPEECMLLAQACRYAFENDAFEKWDTSKMSAVFAAFFETAALAGGADSWISEETNKRFSLSALRAGGVIDPPNWRLNHDGSGAGAD
jgi:hypothetical protein